MYMYDTNIHLYASENSIHQMHFMDDNLHAHE